jgi:hypothetical protein
MHRSRNRYHQHRRRGLTTTPSSSPSHLPIRPEVRQSAPGPDPCPGHWDAAIAASLDWGIDTPVQGGIVDQEEGNVEAQQAERVGDVVNVN